jgi:hypothetical protein
MTVNLSKYTILRVQTCSKLNLLIVCVFKKLHTGDATSVWQHHSREKFPICCPTLPHLAQLSAESILVLWLPHLACLGQSPL